MFGLRSRSMVVATSKPGFGCPLPLVEFDIVQAAKAKFTRRITQSLSLAFPHHPRPSWGEVSRLFFAEPLFRASSPDLEHVQKLGSHSTLASPGAHLAAAFQYYWIEAYADEADRNAACGLAAHPDVKYIAVEASDIPTREREQIACGYPIGHRRFDKVFDPIFARAMCNLVEAISRSDRSAEIELSIARTRYTITPIPGRRGRVKFRIDALSLFEGTYEESLERGAEFLEERLVHAVSRPFTVH